MHAPPRCSSARAGARTGSRSMTQMTQARRPTRCARTGSSSRAGGLAAPGLRAGGLAGSTAGRRERWGGRARATGQKSYGGFAKNFLFFSKPRYAHCMSFQSLPFAPREIRATEKVLQAIYDAAKIGLKGDSLALAAGLLPTEYRRLCQLDPIVEMAEQKGRADGEAEAATQLHLAAKSGDTKASLAILTHVHGWVAKQQVQVDIKQQISITAALQEAESRVVAGRLAQDARAPLTIEGEHATADL